MNDKPTCAEAAMTAQLERLVCGELEESARSSLLDWLEEDLSRWRLCGLAFLEAQTLSESLGPWAAAADRRAAPRQAALPEQGKSGRRRRLAANAMAMAACLLAAFGVGWQSHTHFSAQSVAGPAWEQGAGAGVAGDPDMAEGQPAADSSGGKRAGRGKREEMSDLPLASARAEAGPVLASVAVRPGLAAGLAASIQLAVEPAKASREGVPAVESTLASIPDYVRRQWERRGYQFQSQRRYLFARLPDGERVVVPVDQIQMSYVGARIH